MKVYGVIYTLIDGTNDMEYVGQTTRSVEQRFKEHCREKLRIGKAIRAHGVDMFAIAILKICYSKAELDFWERHLIKSRDTLSPNGYNLTAGGEGFIPCDETRARISAAKMGERNPLFGKHHSPEHRAKISAKMSVAMLGNKNGTGKRTPEFCAKISLANKGKKKSPAHRAKLAAANKGKHQTNETRAKLSAINRGNSPFKNLLQELDSNNLSYVALAKLMELPRTSLSYRMRGERNFNDSDKAKLVEIFGKPIEYLLKRDE